MNDVVLGISTVRAVAPEKSPPAVPAILVRGPDHLDGTGRVQRTACACHRDDVDIVASRHLRLRQVVNVHFDAAESRVIRVGDVKNPH